MKRPLLAAVLFFASAGVAHATTPPVRMVVRTARSAHFALRPCAAARLRSDAAASLTTLRLRSLPMFAPFPLIGVDEPMFDTGDIARTSAACEIQTPALAARAPFGATYTTIGSFADSSSWTILRIESSSPPGVSSRITSAS